MIQTTEQITQSIESESFETTSKMLRHLIEQHEIGEGKRRRKLLERYTQEDVPIYRYEYADYEKAHERIPNDFFGDVVDTKTGYMGNEITVSLDKEKYKDSGNLLREALYDRDAEWLHDWQTASNSLDLNSEAVKLAAATGVAYRLMYIDVDGTARIRNLPAHEVIYVYDGSLYEPVLALRYYKIQDVRFDIGDKISKAERRVVEWYDERVVRYYIDDGYYRFQPYETDDHEFEQVHNLDGIPVMPFPNNEETKAQAEKAIRLIDAYDVIVSSTTSEFEQLRMAYLALKGSGAYVDAEFMHKLEQTGIFALSEDGSAEFINKVIQAEALAFMLGELRKNIYAFSSAIDMTTDFSGDMRVIGLQIALLPMENSCKITERKFTRAMREQYRLLTEYWRRTGQADIDPTAIDYTFTRNFPKDTQSEAQTLQLLKGVVSDQTAFAQMSFIDDPERESQRIETERELYGNAIDIDADTEDEDADEESEDTAQ